MTGALTGTSSEMENSASVSDYYYCLSLLSILQDGKKSRRRESAPLGFVQDKQAADGKALNKFDGCCWQLINDQFSLC